MGLSTISLQATLIVALVLVSAAFSAAGTALIGASRARLLALEKKGNRRAAFVNLLRERQDRVVAAILIGNTIVDVVASALATVIFVGRFSAAGIAYAAITMTIALVVIAEILPRAFALTRADRVALALAPFLRVTLAGLLPIADAVHVLVNAILGVSRSGTAENGAETAEDELRGAIALHGEAATETREERAMLRSILDLAEVEISEVMVHRRNVVSFDADLPPTTVVEQALASPHSRIPLWRGQPENIVGVLHSKALLPALRLHGGNIDAIGIADLMSPPWFVPDTTTLLDQLQAFRQRREHFAVVVDEYGALMGVVTLQDIIEDIVGDIDEGHDMKLPGVRAQPDGSYIVDGQVTIRDLNREFDWGLPDEEATTIAGLVLHEARRIPEVGQKFRFHGFGFKILRRRRNQVTQLRLKPPANPGANRARNGTIAEAAEG